MGRGRLSDAASGVDVSSAQGALLIVMSAMSASVNGKFSTKDPALSAMQAVRHPFYALEQEGWRESGAISDDSVIKLCFR